MKIKVLWASRHDCGKTVPAGDCDMDATLRRSQRGSWHATLRYMPEKQRVTALARMAGKVYRA
jgi:hypothetical protein